MSSVRRKGFAKTRACPSSQELLSYRRRELLPNRVARIELHTTSCDFCAAELQFLSAHSLARIVRSPAVMPPHLRALAEALMGRDYLARLALLESIYEKDQPTVGLSH